MSWVELLERVARLSGVRHPLLVLPPETAEAARLAESLRLPFPISPEGVVLMAQNWRYSSRKARRELGHRPRPLDDTLGDTVAWYAELERRGALGGGPRRRCRWPRRACGWPGAPGVLGGLRVAGRYLGRRLVAGG